MENDRRKSGAEEATQRDARGRQDADSHADVGAARGQYCAGVEPVELGLDPVLPTITPDGCGRVASRPSDDAGQDGALAVLLRMTRCGSSTIS